MVFDYFPTSHSGSSFPEGTGEMRNRHRDLWEPQTEGLLFGPRDSQESSKHWMDASHQQGLTSRAAWQGDMALSPQPERILQFLHSPMPFGEEQHRCEVSDKKFHCLKPSGMVNFEWNIFYKPFHLSSARKDSLGKYMISYMEKMLFPLSTLTSPGPG